MTAMTILVALRTLAMAEHVHPDSQPHLNMMRLDA